MSNNILVIGSGGREHAICWKLAQSLKVKTVFAAPGNVGIETLNKAKVVELDIKNFNAVTDWCLKEGINLVVVGPEDPLASGIADALSSAGIKCFGPSKLAARIEADKDWAKQFMDRHNIPTARWKGFNEAKQAEDFINSVPFNALVVKASGLAAGKGVVVAENRAEACISAKEILLDKRFGSAGDKVIVEELLEGPEVSVLGFSDGNTIKAMVPAQDHKRALDGDLGLNTGGMGAYCPCPLLTPSELAWVEQNVLQRAINGLKQENVPFVGVLYAGLMLTKDGPKVLEFNCRFGDPETEAILPMLMSDLFEIMMACCEGKLKEHPINWATDMSTVAVIMASKGYPQSASKGDLIQGVEQVAQQNNVQVFHCGTARTPSGLVTAGGRVLAVVAQSYQLPVAAARATAAAADIHFTAAQYRKDIAHKGIPKWILDKGGLTYKASGVDIVAGDSVVGAIKSAVAATRRPGVKGQLGGFGALFDLKATQFQDPILVSGTDGVGTKIKVALECEVYNTIGQDLVAMCVNDVLCQGAEPLFFLDYFACGHLSVEVASDVICSIAEACSKANCALVGGETAEMRGLYSKGDFDLAGFVVGAVERDNVLPRLSQITGVNDVVLGLPSSGIHSNGYSLVHKVMQQQGLSFKDKAPFSSRTLGEELLTPTTLYVKSVLPVLKEVKAIAHITGGGLLENIPRVLPPGVKVKLDATSWKILPVFGWLAATGMISEREMLRTFNCGVGLVLIVGQDKLEQVRSQLPEAVVIGSVLPRVEGKPQVEVENFAVSLEPVMHPYIKPLIRQMTVRKRVAVIISGSGTNLQSLIDSTTSDLSMGAEIVLVISNKPGVEGLRRAEKAGIPTEVIKHTEFSSRQDFEAAIQHKLMAAGVEIVCLAGFMRILTSDFVKQWKGRLLNIHPSLLPSFKGTNTHRQVLSAGVRITGCTVHFVEQDIDAGAIIAQKAVVVEVDDTEDSLAERVKTAEHIIYPQSLKLLATGQIYLDHATNKIIWK